MSNLHENTWTIGTGSLIRGNCKSLHETRAVGKNDHTKHTSHYFTLYFTV